MIDTIGLYINEYELDYKYSFKEISNKIMISNYKSGNKIIVGYLRNMRIQISETSLSIMGSLSKWHFGNNIQCLSLVDTKKAIASLEEEIGIPLENARVTKLDIGANIEMKYKPELYLNKLSSLGKLHRGSFKKSSLYFTNEYSTKLRFYDKKKEVKKKDRNNLIMIDAENLLRYELSFFNRFKDQFGSVYAKDLYCPSFYLKMVKGWYTNYMKIEKKTNYDLLNVLKFTGKKDFRNSIVLFICSNYNVSERLEEAFKKGEIDSSEKHLVKSAIKEALNTPINTTEKPLIDELTEKVEAIYQGVMNSIHIEQ